MCDPGCSEPRAVGCSALAKIQGAIVTTTPEALFFCVQNAGRSQMTAALLDYYAAGRITVRSAGPAPAATINRSAPLRPDRSRRGT
jgi:arsenate reductase